ncbi:MAG: M23 family metallopeptidase [Spirochaetaceae bacterium]|nr:M23 family metallopeptidase [Spirochaetaceae bacterium]
MQIISYLNYENSQLAEKDIRQVGSPNRKSLLRKASVLSFSTSDAVGKSINIGLAEKYSDTVSKQKKGFLPFLLYSLLFVSVLALACVAIFYVVSRSQKSLTGFSFAQSDDAKNELSKYLFPSTEDAHFELSLLGNASPFQEVVFKTYTVKSGDTISGIAAAFGLRSMGTLIALNNIEHVKRLQVGFKLTIPSVDGIFHTVKNGETLGSIANKYGLTVNNLLDSNNLQTDVISVGDTIFIPGGRLSNFELKKALGELFIYPITGRLTSPFGYRKDPFTGQLSFHNGIDLANSKGTPIKNIMDGRVSEVGYNNVYGNYIIITHDAGYQSMYGHLNTVYVKRGASVNQGVTIGTVGSTGRSTGPHLHLSIYKNGKLIDPLSVLEK